LGFGNGFEVVVFELGDLGGGAEVGADRGGGVGAELVPEVGVVENLEDGLGEFGGGAFGDEEAVGAGGDGFGDAAVGCGDDGEAGGHGFEHGVGDAFLVGFGSEFAGVEEEVGGLVFLLELLGFEPAFEFDVFGQAESGGTGADCFGLGAVAAEDVAQVGMRFDDGLEGVEGGEDAFFGDEAAGLDEAPVAVGRVGALGDLEVVEGDGGAVEAEFFGGAAEGLEAVEEGLAAGEDELGGGEDFAELVEVTGLVEEFGGIDAMEGDDPGAAPVFEHAEEADGFMAVVDVDEVGGVGAEALGHVIGVAGANVFVDADGRGPLADDVFVPEAEEEVAFGAVVKLGHFGDGFEGEEGTIFDALGVDEGADAGEADDLAVDAAHLGLQVGTADADDEGSGVRGWGVDGR
jgi:hypothetical protein